MTGVELIAKERARQQATQPEGEGWAQDRDDYWNDADQLACAAAVYAMPERLRAKRKRGLWKWASAWYKPCPHDRIRELEKAGALIAAEIDRLLRAQIAPKGKKNARK